MHPVLNRKLINPILATSSCLTVISGIALFSHIESHFIEMTHEVGAFIMLAFAILHIVLNWKPLTKSIGKSVYICAAIVIVCTGIMFVTGEEQSLESIERQYQEALLELERQTAADR